MFDSRLNYGNMTRERDDNPTIFRKLSWNNDDRLVDAGYDQEGYGNVMSGSQNGYHLTTKEYDSVAGLYYFWQRWYDAGVGRFISKAPMPVELEHAYGYVENNPMNSIDPTGQFPLAPILEEAALCLCGCAGAIAYAEFKGQSWDMNTCLGGCAAAMTIPINKYLWAIVAPFAEDILRSAPQSYGNANCPTEGDPCKRTPPMFPGDPGTWR